jgi:hypothetical protein
VLGAATYSGGVTVRAARSHNEAMMFVLLRDCGACHSTNRDVTDDLDIRDGEAYAEYTAFCRECRNIDVYTFRLPDTDPQAGESGVVFGGAQPSGIIDPGEWLAFAHTTSVNGPVEPDGLAEPDRQEAALAMEAAAAAVREVVKFIEPGQERLPRSALWSDKGRAEFDRDPWRFSRSRLAVIDKAYRESAGRLAGGRPMWK